MKLNTTAAPADHVYDLGSPEAIDGDTIKAKVDLGFHIEVTVRIRLKGFYAPELAGNMPDQGWAAKTLLQGILNSGRCQIRRRGMKMDQNGRYLAVLMLDGAAVDPHVALGCYQLTEQDHAEDLKAQRRNQGRAPR